MGKQNKIDNQKQIEIAAETLAHILIQQAISKKSNITNKKNGKNYGK